MSLNISEAEKQRLLGKMPCANLKHCQGPPKCYAYHPPNDDVPANINRNNNTAMKSTNDAHAGTKRKPKPTEKGALYHQSQNEKRCVPNPHCPL